mgnify:FL=1
MIGAPQPLVLAKPAAIDTAQAARYFGARGEPDDRTMTLLETCAMPLLAAATPRAVWLEADTAALAEAGILRGGDVMKHLDLFNGLGYPMLLGTSRKSMIGLTLDLPVSEREEGTLVTTVMAVQSHYGFVRVHDAEKNRRAIKMTEVILARE